MNCPCWLCTRRPAVCWSQHPGEGVQPALSSHISEMKDPILPSTSCRASLFHTVQEECLQTQDFCSYSLEAYASIMWGEGIPKLSGTARLHGSPLLPAVKYMNNNCKSFFSCYSIKAEYSASDSCWCSGVIEYCLWALLCLLSASTWVQLHWIWLDSGTCLHVCLSTLGTVPWSRARYISMGTFT